MRTSKQKQHISGDTVAAFFSTVPKGGFKNTSSSQLLAAIKEIQPLSLLAKILKGSGSREEGPRHKQKSTMSAYLEQG